MCVCMYAHIYSIVIFYICMSLFESTLLSFFANPSQNWTFQFFTRVAEKERTQLNNVDSNNNIQIRKITILRLESIVDIHRKNAIYIHTYTHIYIYTYIHTYTHIHIYKDIYISNIYT